MSDQNNDKKNRTCFIQILNIVSITIIVALVFAGLKCLIDSNKLNIQLGGSTFISLDGLLDSSVSETMVTL
jgi:hypothetical protein